MNLTPQNLEKLRGQPVTIQWLDPSYDWQTFTVLTVDSWQKTLRLRYRDDPETGMETDDDTTISAAISDMTSLQTADGTLLVNAEGVYEAEPVPTASPF